MLLSATSLHAQEPAATPLAEIVVTGVAASQGINKQDASFAITSLSADDIRDLNPSSAADLLKGVPGIWPESSGGVTGANIDIAGFPGGGDAPFVTYQLNGSPLYPAATLSFMDNSSQFRLDDTVERAEVVQGGPAIVLASGQIGATANFILRRGTPTPHAELALTAGTEGLYRLDGFYGGPLLEDWRFSAGGFYRISDGIRSSQFLADNGGQLTVTLSRPTERGAILFFARELDDQNLFITDIPVGVTGAGAATTIGAFPGFNPNTGTFAGNALRCLSVPEAPGSAPLQANLSKGRGTTLHTVGSDWDWSSSTLSLSNHLMGSLGEVDCYCLFNNSAPQTLSSFVATELALVNADSAITDLYGAAHSGTAASSTDGVPLRASAYVASLGFWVVRKQIHSITDELRLTLSLPEDNQLTLGVYLAGYSASDHWWLGNDELVTAQPNASPVNLTLDNGVQVTNAAGLLNASSYTLVQRWSGFNAALFASNAWSAGRWRLDAGARLERQRHDGFIENTASVNLTNNVLTLFDKGVSVPTGTFNHGVACDSAPAFAPCTQYQHSFGSGSLGANYEATAYTSLFARLSKGVHFPSFDDLRSGIAQAMSVKEAELGIREQDSGLTASAELFYRRFRGAAFQQFISVPAGAPAGTLPYIDGSFGAASYGLEWQARWQLTEHWSVAVLGDKIHATYTQYDTGTGADYTGNILDRQPSLQVRLTPEYRQAVPWGTIRWFASYTYAGLSYSDVANLQVLPAFYVLDAGVSATVGEHTQIRVQGSNLTNQLGLTEGNARVAPGDSGISTHFEMARPIFGREVNLQLRYTL